MILRRLGNKKKLADKIRAHFPRHSVYIEPFFGAGGMFFNKPKSKYNIVNDLDSEVFNLFNTVLRKKEQLLDGFKKLPIHEDLLKEWKTKQESDPILKSLRFLFLSNFTYLGKQDTISYRASKNDKNVFYNNIDQCFAYLDGCKFHNADFEKFLSDISFPKLDFGKPSTQKEKTFIYCDPPYLETTNTYCSGFSQDDVNRLFDVLNEKGCKYAVSEFNHPFILEQAKQRNLNIIHIGERRNINNRKTEILITNYENRQQKLF